MEERAQASADSGGSVTAPPVEVEGVWKVFGPTPQAAIELSRSGTDRQTVQDETGCLVAVADVSFRVERGETFVVMGLSGSGKSTLIRCMSRLIDATAGDIRIDGQSIAELDDDGLRDLRRQKISMVFQHFGLFPHRRVIDNVAFGLEVQGVSRQDRYERAMDVLDTVGLTGWGDHYPQQLSGGMQQRVGLARALTVDPEILFFDEPFSALDPLIRRNMQDELLELQQRMQRTLVFITHDFHEALRLGDHVAIMKDGAIVQIGTPEQVVAHPADDYVEEFTRDAPKSAVVTAAAVLKPHNGGPVVEPVDLTAPLAELLPRLLGSDDDICVADDDGTIVGVVDRDTVAALLASGPDS